MFLLFFIPYTSLGLAGDSFTDDDRAKQFQNSVSNLLNGLDLLIGLAKQGYAPAQQLLALLSRNFSEAEEFIKRQIKLQPSPLQTGYSETNSQFRKAVKVGGMSTVEQKIAQKIETAMARHSFEFDDAISHMTDGLNLLDPLLSQGYGPAIDFRNNFNRQTISHMIQVGLPLYSLSLNLKRRCERALANHFVSGRSRFVGKSRGQR